MSSGGERPAGAYDLPERVVSYDADMEVMHPNRTKMVDVALDALPFDRQAPVRALDLGAGTAFFTDRFLARFPRAGVVAVDEARAMVDLATARLGPRADRVEFRIGDFRRLDAILTASDRFDVAFSSFALHHLSRAEKVAAVARSLAAIRSGGWFVNADIVVFPAPAVAARVQELRVAGIVARAAGRIPRFADAASTRQALEELERRDADQPLTLEEDLAVLREAGLAQATLLWAEYRETVMGGPK